uniref:GS catalytic domain-containing protein n=1 Tax=Percolomonas cosmopolitus TaxID=63605 RepID=A0A7S1KL89_9EUKA
MFRQSFRRGATVSPPTCNSAARLLRMCLASSPSRTFSSHDPFHNANSRVFNDATMKQYLPPQLYQSFSQMLRTTVPISDDEQDELAYHLQHWAMERGATTFSHLFTPIRGNSASRKEAFVARSKNGDLHREYIGRDLFRKERIAISSYPGQSNRVKASTLWDVTSPPFVLNQTLYMPAMCRTEFGTIDEKTPHLRSIKALREAAARLCSVMGSDGFENKQPVQKLRPKRITDLDDDSDGELGWGQHWTGNKHHSKHVPTSDLNDMNDGSGMSTKSQSNSQSDAANAAANAPLRVLSNVSWEQEFYLVPKQAYLKRPDLIQTQQTLVGAPPHKARFNHFFSKQPEIVQKFLNEVQSELWQVGVPLSSSLSEVSFGQHELCSSPVPSNVSADHNLLLKELMGSVSSKFGLYTIFHEKPFLTMQGSSTHMNWSIDSEDGVKMFEPGTDAASQTRFVVFIAALIRATHSHQDCIRVSCATAANDLRLASNDENPSTIISLSLGDTLTNYLKKIETSGEIIPKGFTDFKALSKQLKKSSDEVHRTSPFAFTNGSCFEFRCQGSSDNLNFPLCILNTILADSLDHFARELERGKSVSQVVVETLKQHSDIIYNGDCHSKSWEKEAQRRGLLNSLKSTPQAFQRFRDAKNKELFKRHKIFSPQELDIRSTVKTEQYIETFLSAASCMLELQWSHIIPAAENDTVSDLSLICRERKQKLLKQLDSATERLRTVYEGYPANEDPLERAFFCTKLWAEMDAVREIADAMEPLVSHDLWPLSKFRELLLAHDEVIERY